MTTEVPLRLQARWPAQLLDRSAERARRPAGVADRTPGSALKLVELRNDDGHVCGWISLGEAVALALANIAEKMR